MMAFFGSELFAKLGLFILEWVATRQQMKKEDREYFIKIAQALREKGLRDVKSRFESESQIDAANQEWDKRDAQN